MDALSVPLGLLEMITSKTYLTKTSHARCFDGGSTPPMALSG